MSAWKSMRAVLAINQKRNRDSKLPREKAQRGADKKLRGRVVGSRVASWQRMPESLQIRRRARWSSSAALLGRVNEGGSGGGGGERGPRIYHAPHPLAAIHSPR